MFNSEKNESIKIDFCFGKAVLETVFSLHVHAAIARRVPALKRPIYTDEVSVT